jgi:hypothetical protein
MFKASGKHLGLVPKQNTIIITGPGQTIRGGSSSTKPWVSNLATSVIPVWHWQSASLKTIINAWNLDSIHVSTTPNLLARVRYDRNKENDINTVLNHTAKYLPPNLKLPPRAIGMVEAIFGCIDSTYVEMCMCVQSNTNIYIYILYILYIYIIYNVIKPIYM